MPSAQVWMERRSKFLGLAARCAYGVKVLRKIGMRFFLINRAWALEHTWQRRGAASWFLLLYYFNRITNIGFLLNI